MVTRIYNSDMNHHVIEHAHRENTASVTANNDMLTVDITPSKTPCKLIIYISMAEAGKLDLFRNGIATGERLNDDVSLIEDTVYEFPVEIARGDDEINLQYSVNSAINQLIVKEVPE